MENKRLFNGIAHSLAALLIAILLSVCVLFGFYGCGGKEDELGTQDGQTTENGMSGDSETSTLPNIDIPENPDEPETPGETTDEEEKPTTPTEPEPPQVKTDTLVCSSVNGLSVRSGPGTSYTKLGSMDKGDMLSFISLSDGWYKVNYRNSVAYVSAAYLSEVSFAVGSQTVEKVIDEGKKLLGTPYVYGAQRYHYGSGNINSAFDINEFDCSSLMQYIFKIGADVNLNTTTRTQSTQGTAVDKSDIRRGDLLFFTNASRKDNVGVERIGHVALYLGDNYILHTASDFAVIEQISTQRWSYYICARRVVA